MNCSRLVLVALGALWGCSGKYVISGSTDSSGGGGTASSGAGSTSVAGDRNAIGGAPAAAGGGAMSAGGAVSVGGAVSTGGAMGMPSYCGSIPPTVPVNLAPPIVVWNRVQAFLLDQVSPAPELPAVTTREWAGTLAQNILTFSANAPPGLNRFVTNFWPGTKSSQRYAFMFDGGYTVDTLLAPDNDGLLLDPALLALPTIPDRGAYIAQHLLCVNLPPPPPGLPPSPPPTNGATRRAQYEASVAAPVCSSCHRLMDPLGDALEHYATDGTFSNVDNGLQIDSSGSYALMNSGSIMFSDVNDLAKQLSSTCEVAQCLAQQLLADAQTAAAVPTDPNADPALVMGIVAQLMGSKRELRSMVIAIVESDAFLRAAP